MDPYLRDLFWVNLRDVPGVKLEALNSQTRTVKLTTDYTQSAVNKHSGDKIEKFKHFMHMYRRAQIPIDVCSNDGCTL